MILLTASCILGLPSPGRVPFRFQPTTITIQWPSFAFDYRAQAQYLCTPLIAVFFGSCGLQLFFKILSLRQSWDGLAHMLIAVLCASHNGGDTCLTDGTAMQRRFRLRPAPAAG
jgi:hypothetical protein